MQENIALKKSKAFAIRIINLYRYLCDTKKEYVLSQQLLRSGTSIGANLSEAVCAISRKDFAAKVYIALKECSETSYWLELLYSTEYLTEEQYKSIDNDCRELLKILMATTKSISISEL